MGSKNLVICDSDIGYASKLAAFLCGKRELAFQVEIYESPARMLEAKGDKRVYCMLISDEYPYEERKEIAAERTIVLASGAWEKEGAEEEAVLKYQPAGEIYKQILDICAKKGEEEFFRPCKKGKGKMIGFYSPVHRAGQTTLALCKGKELGKEENALYLNLEIYAGFGGHFRQDKSRNLSTLLYYARQETGNIGLVLTTVVKKAGDLDYVPPVVCPEDLRGVKTEEWLWIFQEILRTSIYDVLILDLSECIQGLYEILRECDAVYCLGADDRYAAAKIKQFKAALRHTGYADV